MYAKLVCSTALSPLACIRDIARLLTSESPSTSLLGAFSSTSSVIIDPTPAGWSYVGSNQTAEQNVGGVAIIGTTNVHTPVASIAANIVLSAPCLNTGLLKYATLNTVSTTDGLPTSSTAPANNKNITLSIAQSANSSGVCVNEAGRLFASTTSGDVTSSQSFQTYTGNIFHLIATPRHITLIQEGKGLIGIWETSNTDAHTFYNAAPYVLYNHADASLIAANTGINTPTLINISVNYLISGLVNITNVNTGVFSGAKTVPASAASGGFSFGSFFQTSPNNNRLNTINASGSPKYQISPVFFQDGAAGYPTQFITGVVPIYWTKAGLGNSGDTVDVNGVNYTYFNCGSTNNFGVIMTTGN